MNRPTIAELEAILEEKGVQIDIRPNGEVLVCDKTQVRVAELEAQLQAANARAEAAERNINVLQKQLANCHDTMRKDGVRHAKLLLAVEDDQADAARLREALEEYAEPLNWIGYENRVWRTGEPGYAFAQAALRPAEQSAESDE